jgi:hypothetical protein
MTQSTETKDKPVIPATNVDLALFLQSTGVLASSETILTDLLATLEAPAQRLVGPDLALFFSINPSIRRSFVRQLLVSLLSGPLAEAGIECLPITGIQSNKKTGDKVLAASAKKRKTINQ